MPYLSKRALEHLTQYTYASELEGYLDALLNHMWNAMAKLLPAWLAPNLITLLGLLHVLFAAAMFHHFSPDFEGTLPSWAYYLTVYLMFMYQTLDALDGKQARQTGSSSPLGQLFDHGCDAITAVLTSIFVAVAIKGGSSWLTGASLFLHIVPFYVSNWEACHTHVMRHGLVGVTEGQYIIMGCMFFSGRFGEEVWSVPREWAFGLELRHILLVAGLVGVFAQCWTSVVKVRQHYRRAPHHRHQAWDQLLQFVAFVVFSIAWMASPTGVYRKHTMKMVLTCGFLFVYMVARLIIAHVTGSYHSRFHALLGPLILLTINSWARSVLPATFCEDIVLNVYLAIVLVVYAEYVFKIINEITSYLDIHCFFIKKPSALFHHGPDFDPFEEEVVVSESEMSDSEGEDEDEHEDDGGGVPRGRRGGRRRRQ